MTDRSESVRATRHQKDMTTNVSDKFNEFRSNDYKLVSLLFTSFRDTILFCLCNKKNPETFLNTSNIEDARIVILHFSSSCCQQFLATVAGWDS